MKIFLRIFISIIIAAGMIVAQELGAVDLGWDDIFPPEPVEMPEESSFSIEFLDVGEGDSALISCDGHFMLIDGGSSEYSSFLYSKLKNDGITRLDCVVATHPDADHVGGLSGALNYAKTDAAYCNTDTRDTKSFNSFIKYLEKQGKKITIPDAGDSFELGSAQVTILGPEKGETYSDNTSLVIRIVYGNTSFLFMGDSEYWDEQHLIDSGCQLKSTVLKVAHHGSRSSSSKGFLDKVKPKYAVISVGKDNPYGHPKEEVLERLEKLGTEIYRTDINGNIKCFSDGNEVSFEKTGN